MKLTRCRCGDEHACLLKPAPAPEAVERVARERWLRRHDQHVYDGGTTWEAFRDGYRAALAAMRGEG